MEEALGELAGQKDGMRRQKAASLAGALDLVLKATLFKQLSEGEASGLGRPGSTVGLGGGGQNRQIS